MRKNNLFKLFCMSLALVLCASVFSLFGALRGERDFASADSSTTYIKSGYCYDSLNETSSTTVSTKGLFTAQFNSTFTASVANPTYILTLKKSGVATNFLGQTKFAVTNYTSTKDAGYSYTNSTDTSSINLSLANNGGVMFGPTYTVGTSVNEKIQVQIDFSRTLTEMTAGSYQLVLTRSGTELAAASFTLSSIKTTFALQYVSGRTSLYSDSLERFNFNINFTNDNNDDTDFAQMGRGVKVTLYNSAGTNIIPWPVGTQIILTDNNEFNSQASAFELENGINYAFNTSGTVSSPKIDIRIPNGQGMLADGSYKIKFELFVQDNVLVGTSGDSSLSFTQSISYSNVNYGALNVETMIKPSAVGDFAEGLVYYINRPANLTKSAGLAFDIEFNSVPNDAKIQYAVEKRIVNDNVLSFSEVASTKQFMTVSAFKTAANSGSGLGCGVIYTDSGSNHILTTEGVYRFRIEIYDRNCGASANATYLKKTCYAYFVCANSTVA